MRLDPKHYTLGTLLQGRLFRIPDYQRPYAWGKIQREELFSDITGVYKTDQDHFMATVVALLREPRKIQADEFQSADIVDGQQRITTLIILFKAIQLALNSDDSTESKIKREIGELLVKGDDHSLVLLRTNHDSSNVFVDYIRTGQYSTGHQRTEAEKNLIEACADCERFVKNWASTASLVELVAILRHRLSVIYHELTDEASVYRVFEVLNSRGLDVKSVDKLKSQLMALLFTHAESGSRVEALGEMQEIWQGIYRTAGLRGSMADEAMRFAGTFALNYLPKRIVDEQTAAAELTKFAGVELKSIVNAARWVSRVIQAIDKIDTDQRLKAVTSVMHARFVAAAIVMRDFNKTEHARLMAEWEKTTFRIFGLGGADKRNKVGDYVMLAYDIVVKKIDANSVFSRLGAIPGDDYGIDVILENSDWTECYPSWSEPLRYLLYRYEEHLAAEHGEKINVGEWNKIWSQDPSKSIEHIKPQSSEVAYVHHLGNLTMLPPGINSSLRDKPPSQKTATYEACGIRSTRQIAETIKTEGWTQAHVKARAEAIVQFIRKEWAS